MEKYNRITKYKEIGSWDQNYLKIKTDDLYVLPSVNPKYSLNEKTNLRLAISQTYTKQIGVRLL